MRIIRKIILHCSASAEGRPLTIDDIRRWHIRHNGWSDIGYHYVVHLDGSVHAGRPEAKIGAHCAGHNADSIGVCYVGGLAADGKTPKDTRTPAQKEALRQLVGRLKTRYPNATLHGHREFSSKYCPSFHIKDL